MSNENSWVWTHFTKSTGRHKNNKYAYSAWCKGCLTTRVEELRKVDVESALSGIGATRSEEQLLDAAMTETPGNWVKCRTGKPKQHLLPHLKTCKNVVSSVREKAQEALKEKEKENPDTSSSPVRSTHFIPSTHPLPHPLQPSASISSSTSNQSSTETHSCELPRSKQSKTEHWTADHQREFADELCEVLVATGTAFNYVNHHRVKGFFTKWIPGCIVPSDKTMSGPVLNGLIKEVEKKDKVFLEGKLATGQSDGWKNVAKQSVVATIMTVDGECHLIRTRDITSEAKTGDNLFQIVLEDIEEAQQVYGVEIIGWCADDGGDPRKMRRLLLQHYPWLIVVVCWAHQINLCVGDILDLDLPVLSCVSEALEVIKWFNSHTRAIGLLKREQRSLPGGKVLSLILPVITRWTAHYCSLSRLLEVGVAIRACYVKYSSILNDMAGESQAAKDKAAEVEQIVNDDAFWQKVHITKQILEPFAIAANMTQGPSTRLDHVLLALANLFRMFDADRIPASIRTGVHQILEKRWKKADEDLFIAAVVMNPWVRDSAFQRDLLELTPAGLYQIVSRVCKRIMRVTDVGWEFHKVFLQYLNKEGVFSRTWMSLDSFREAAEAQGKDLDVICTWKCLRIESASNSGANLLVRFAIRLLSLVANSAGCERAFSEFGIIHTNRRNRLSLDTVRKLGVLKMDLKRQDREAGLVHPRKRKFAEAEDDTSPTTTQSSQSSTSTSEARADDPTRVDSNANSLLTNLEPVEFHDVAQQLVQDARQSRALDAEEDHCEAEEAHREARDAVPIAALLLSTTRNPPTRPSRSINSKTNIPLRQLFRFPASSDDLWDGSKHYWNGAVKNLQFEMEEHEIATDLTDE